MSVITSIVLGAAAKLALPWSRPSSRSMPARSRARWPAPSSTPSPSAPVWSQKRFRRSISISWKARCSCRDVGTRADRALPAGLAGQFALLQAEQAEGFWQSAWRWGWMYLLAFFWTCAFLLFPIVRLFGFDLDPIDTATLGTLTGWFISLYMGGHTVKELGKQAVEAVKTWRGPHV